WSSDVCSSDLPLRALRLGVEHGQLGGALDHVARDLAAAGVLDHDVAAGRAATDVQPEVLRFGHLEREPVVVPGALADEDLVAAVFERLDVGRGDRKSVV